MEPPPVRKFGLFVRKMGWRLTIWGWLVVLVLPMGLATLWAFFGEKFLTIQQRDAKPDILVVEGWIGREALASAASEFISGGYRFVVTTGGQTSDGWSDQRWWYCEMAEKELLKGGVPKEKIIVARPVETGSQRTFQEAVAARTALASQGVSPATLTVFSSGVHGRRSRLVFSKVFQSVPRVGVISWTPQSHKGAPWWHSSKRSEEFAKESVGWLFELAWSSGRSSN